MNKISCPQTQCSFNGICVGGVNEKVGCQKCEECGCEPNMINENCDRCLSCANDSGCLRWDNNITDLFIKEKNKQKIMEIK